MANRWFIIVFAVLITVVLSLDVHCQEQRAQGYLFVAPGAFSCGGCSQQGTLHAGGGAEVFLVKGLGAGAEVGYLGRMKQNVGGFGVLSTNVLYDLSRGKNWKWHPFVTGGYSLLFPGDTANAFNYGAGFNYWFRPYGGLRIEFRDHILTENTRLHYMGMRIAFTFR